jgi:hypothetical protein
MKTYLFIQGNHLLLRDGDFEAIVIVALVGIRDYSIQSIVTTSHLDYNQGTVILRRTSGGFQ